MHTVHTYVCNYVCICVLYVCLCGWQCCSLGPYSEEVRGLILRPGVFLWRGCMFSPLLCRFSPGALASTHSLESCLRGWSAQSHCGGQSAFTLSWRPTKETLGVEQIGSDWMYSCNCKFSMFVFQWSEWMRPNTNEEAFVNTFRVRLGETRGQCLCLGAVDWWSLST